MNNKELSKRVNYSGDVVVASFESFKKEYQTQKNNLVNTQNTKQMDAKFQSLNSAVNDLKRSMEISRDPRFNRY